MKGRRIVLCAVLVLAIGVVAVLRVRAYVFDCSQVQLSNRYLFVYGNLFINGQPAPANTIVEARNAAGVTAGCKNTDTPGIYPLMHVYGADTSVVPNVPGMANNEPIRFYVNGFAATPSPALNWTNSKASTQVTLTTTIHSVFVPNSIREASAGW